MTCQDQVITASTDENIRHDIDLGHNTAWSEHIQQILKLCPRHI